MDGNEAAFGQGICLEIPFPFHLPLQCLVAAKNVLTLSLPSPHSLALAAVKETTPLLHGHIR